MNLFFLSLHWIPTIFLVLILILSLSFLLKQRKVKKAANFPPGPPKLPIIGNTHQIGNGNHHSLWNLSKTYGPAMLLQLGRNQVLVISSPQLAKEVLKNHDVERCTKPKLHAQEKLTYNFLTIAFFSYNDSWRQMRKLFMTELFTKSKMQSFECIRKVNVTQLIDSIAQNSPNSIDPSEKTLTLTYSIIYHNAFSRDYEEMEGGKLRELNEEAMQILGLISTVDILPWLGGIVDAIMGLPRRIEKCYHRFDSLFERLLDDHLDPTRPRLEQEDVVDVMLNVLKDEKTSFISTKEHIKAVLLDILLGGTDTTYATIVWAMTELVKNPRVMKKVQTEIRSCVGRKPNVDESELEKLGYLKMVVKETLRLHPPIALLPREAMSHFKIGDYDINPKTRILINAWAIGRDPNSWKNPNDFYPERFEDNVIDFMGHNFELIPFGSGRRMCPGSIMGFTIVMLTLANLLYCFAWELPNGMKREDISLEENVGFSISRKSPLYLVPIIYDFEKGESSNVG